MRLLLTMVLLFILGVTSITAQEEDFRVYASYSILADVVSQVAGDVLEVRSLIPAGSDPHAFQMSAREIVDLLESDLLFLNGAAFEEGVLAQIIEADASLSTAIASECVALWHVLLGVEFVHEEHHHDDDHADEDHDDEHGHDDDHADEDHDDEHEHDDDHADEDHDDEHEHDDDHADEDHDDEHEHDDDHADDHDDEDHGVAEAIQSCQELRAELGLAAVSDDALLVANDCGDGILMGHDEHDEHEEADGHHHDHASGCDPHVWMDPENAMIWTASVRDVLSQRLPEHAETFAANAEAYLAELRELDRSLTEQLQEVPEPRLFVTLHDFTRYYAVRYGFEVDSVLSSFSSIAEPIPAELAALVDRLSQLGVRALFGEEPLQNRIMVQLAEELGIPLIAVYGGTLSESDGPAATYIDYMLENTRRIAEGLSGNTSE